LVSKAASRRLNKYDLSLRASAVLDAQRRMLLKVSTFREAKLRFRLAVGACTGHHILSYKTFAVKLSEYKALSALIEAHHAPVLMNFPFGFFG
jgi:hypothetical protein